MVRAQDHLLDLIKSGKKNNVKVVFQRPEDCWLLASHLQ